MKRVLFGIIALVLSLGMIGSAFAYFSDTATSTTNTFTAGTLSIDDSELTTATSLTINNMAPGDITDPISFIIRNNGSINLAWLGDWQFSGNATLMGALYIADAKMEFLSPTLADWNSDPTPGYDPGGADHFIVNGTGSGPYPAFYTALAGLSGFNVITFNSWNNNAAMVPGSVYEHAGALKPGYSYKLTVKFGFAAGAGNEYQGLGPVTVKFKVDAAQIVAAQISALTGGWADITWLNAQIADQTEA